MRVRVLRQTGCSVLAALVCLLASEATAQEVAVDLRPRFEPGRRTRYELWYERAVVTTADFAGRSQAITQSFHYDGELTWTVDKVGRDGSATCTMVIDWLAFTTSSSGGERQVNDTRKASGDVPLLHQLLRAMTGKSLRFSVSADGAIQNIDGVAAVRSQAPETLAEAVVDEQFTEMAYDLAIVPNVPAAATVGHRWEFPFRTPHELGWLDERATFTLTGVERVANTPIANISASETLKFEPRLPDLPPEAPKISLRMTKADCDRQIMWDLARHEAVGRNITQSRTFRMRMSFQGRTMTRTVEETSQQQVLRIAEE